MLGEETRAQASRRRVPPCTPDAAISNAVAWCPVATAHRAACRSSAAHQTLRSSSAPDLNPAAPQQGGGRRGWTEDKRRCGRGHRRWRRWRRRRSAAATAGRSRGNGSGGARRGGAARRAPAPRPTARPWPPRAWAITTTPGPPRSGAPSSRPPPAATDLVKPSAGLAVVRGWGRRDRGTGRWRRI